MDEIPSGASGGAAPITEADLHAFVDGRLAPGRRTEVEAFLGSHADERERVGDWQAQNELLHARLDPVLDEPLPLRLPMASEAARWPWRAVAAGLAIAAVSAALAWTARGAVEARAQRLARGASAGAVASVDAELAGFAHRAAIAHAVYSPDARRPVEVGAEQEQALVTWLTRRLGTPVRAPRLSALGYELIGGRLLPGGQGPVAQFMYGSAGGQRLTLYLARDVGSADTSFRFVQDGPVNVFYWVEGRFGYALSASAGRDELLRVSEEVWRQLKPS